MSSLPASWSLCSAHCVVAIRRLALDFFFENIFTSFIIFEISWSCKLSLTTLYRRRAHTSTLTAILWILWISVGATTLSEGKTIFKGQPCSDFDVVLPAAKNICDDIHPIAIIAFVNALLRECSLICLRVLRVAGRGSSSRV